MIYTCLYAALCFGEVMSFFPSKQLCLCCLLTHRDHSLLSVQLSVRHTFSWLSGRTSDTVIWNEHIWLNSIQRNCVCHPYPLWANGRRYVDFFGWIPGWKGGCLPHLFAWYPYLLFNLRWKLWCLMRSEPTCTHHRQLPISYMQVETLLWSFKQYFRRVVWEETPAFLFVFLKQWLETSMF